MAETKPESGSRRSQLSKYASVAFFAVCCGAAYWVTGSSPVSAPPNAGLIVENNTLNFGTTWETAEFPWTFAIRNPTTQDVAIKKLWTSCDCAAIKPESLTVPAGGEAEIAVVLDLRAAFREQPLAFASAASKIKDPVESRPVRFEATIVPQLEDDGAGLPEPWRLIGEVKRVITISPNSLFLHGTQIHGHSGNSGTARVKSHINLTTITAASRDRHVRVAVEPNHDVNEWTLQVSVDADMPVGRFKVPIEIRPLHAAKSLPSYVIDVQGDVLSDIQISPPRLHFGAADVRSVSEELVNVYTLTGQRFKIVGLRPDFDGLDASVQRVDQQSDSYKIHCRQYVKKSGPQRGDLTVLLDAATKGTSEVVIPVQYHGRLKR